MRTTIKMTNLGEPDLSDGPSSILSGVYAAASSQLGVTDVQHPSALLGIRLFDGVSLVAAVHDVVRRNYNASNAKVNKNISAQNWRWHHPQPQISARNKSSEAVVERAVAGAAVELGRTDWSNQVPVASGLVGKNADRRCAIDLVRRIDERHFQLIELKITSDTPLYAAVELLGYASLWLLARADPPERASELLDANTITLRVLAPAAFYARYRLDEVERAFSEGVQRLGEPEGVAMSFGYEILHERVRAGAMPPPLELLTLMDRPSRLHPE